MSVHINPSIVDWESSDSVLLFNEKHPISELLLSRQNNLPDLPGHIWLLTSGTRSLKLIALSKAAVLHSARSVNQHLSVSHKDRWGLCLAPFHIAGLSILARAYVSSSTVFSFHSKWNIANFVDFLKEHQVSISSLVPAQVYDIVQTKTLAPKSLRLVVIGGGALSPLLYQSARKLGWPILPSYGLTECSSQVATAKLSSLKYFHFPKLQILDHVQVKISAQGKIALKSNSLLTGTINLSHLKKFKFHSILKSNWYCTEDQGVKKNQCLEISNPGSLKILGEKVDKQVLEDRLIKILLKYSISNYCYLIAVPHLRSGWQIALVTDCSNLHILYLALRDFNSHCLGVEKIQALYIVPQLPMSGIFKPLQLDMIKYLGFNP